METTGDHLPGTRTVIRVRYQHQQEERVRCFTVDAGELVGIECPAKPQRRDQVAEVRRVVDLELRQGIGDAVATIAKAAGLKERPGCGCARRQAALNRWTPAWLSQLLGRLGRVGSRPGR